MCPSYQVTGEEKDSTRGRAHLLWEMLEGDLITDGWRSTEVRDALDLCMSCKGCLSDCPVNVDMATYKSEFLHHYYVGRLRPASHYSMGWLPLWSRLATIAPAAVNALTGSAMQRLLKRASGIAPERDIPRFASRSLRSLLSRRHFSQQPQTRWAGGEAAAPSRAPSSAAPRRAPSSAAPGKAPSEALAHVPGQGPISPGGKVVLWPDTVTSYLAPEVGLAAVAVLVTRALSSPRGSPSPSPSCWPGMPALDSAAGRRRRARAYELPSARGGRLRGRPRAHEGCRDQRSRSGLGLLWAGRELRLRAWPLRGVQGGGGAGAVAGRPGRGRRHVDHCRRIQLPHPDRAGDRSTARAPGPGSRFGIAKASQPWTLSPADERAADRPSDVG